METIGNRIEFLSEESSTFLVLITIFLIANIYMIIKIIKDKIYININKENLMIQFLILYHHFYSHLIFIK